ncbi:MAG: glycosyltransferase family 2 protein [Janthinobacterium lividum]
MSFSSVGRYGRCCSRSGASRPIRQVRPWLPAQPSRRTAKMPPQISVIIPALNEAESIGQVVASMPWSRIAECIVVDNGSTDETGALAAAAGARVITSPRGYGAAMHAGVLAALPTSEILVFLDGDGADVIEEMPRLVDPITQNQADFVIGSRVAGAREPGSMLPSQVFAAHLISFLVRLLYGFRYTDMGAFRAIRRSSLDAMPMREHTFGWNLEMQIRAVQHHLRILEIPVPYRCRIGGESKVSGNLRTSVTAALRIFGVFFRVRRGA